MTTDSGSSAGDYIEQGSERFIDDGAGMFDSIGSDAEAGWNSAETAYEHGDALGAIVDLGEGVIVDPIVDVGRGLGDMIYDTGETVAGLGEGAWDVAKDAGSAVASGAEDVASGVGGVAEDIGSGIESGASDLVSGVEDLGSDIEDLF